MSNTDKHAKAAIILDEGKPANRGQAFVLLKEAGLGYEGGQFFNAVVKAYEDRTEEKLSASPRKIRENNMTKAHSMTSQDTLKHVTKMGRPDSLFWACWSLFKDGKWEGEIELETFTTHFTPEKVEIDDLLEARCHDLLDSAARTGALMNYTQAYELLVDGAPIDEDTDPKIIKGVIADWQKENNNYELPRSPENQAKHDIHVRSHTMTADEVKQHIASLQDKGEKADSMAWQAWKLFKQGKWQGELEHYDFSPLITKEKTVAQTLGIADADNQVKQPVGLYPNDGHNRYKRETEPAGIDM